MRILIVEDEKTISDLICQFYCSKHGHECVVAHSLAESLATHGEFDAVICDLSLPDSEGWPTLISIRARFPARTPIVILSGQLQETDIPKAINLGASDVLFKPWVSLSEFGRRIDMALARSRHPTIDKLSEKLEAAKSTTEAIELKHQEIDKLKAASKSGRAVLIF